MISAALTRSMGTSMLGWTGALLEPSSRSLAGRPRAACGPSACLRGPLVPAALGPRALLFARRQPLARAKSA